jgi:5-bromo-4-chloroindolyl phosphate hydrolysis protein
MLDFLAPYNNMPQWVVFVLWSEDGLNGAKYFTSTEDVYNTSNRLFYNSCNHEPSEFQDLLTIFFKCLENCVEIANAWSNILACHK